jgi:hypothetical protein
MHRLLIDLRHPVLTHRQLYVEIKRVKERSQVCCLVPDMGIASGGMSWVTTNVVQECCVFL